MLYFAIHYILYIDFPIQELKKVMDKLHDLDGKCVSVQTAMDKELNKNTQLVTELEHVKSSKIEVKKSTQL